MQIENDKVVDALIDNWNYEDDFDLVQIMTLEEAENTELEEELTNEYEVDYTIWNGEED
jgi:hypothetical protein|tara:strand:+ start:7404 stop:7580 length:177 start_codon:yes stop_codon:yes gene_type:complete